MGKGIWVGVNDTARKANNIWVSPNGTAQKVKRMWVGVNNVARLCYTAGVPTTVTLNGAKGDTITYTYEGVTSAVYFSSSSTSKQITIEIFGSSATITFRSSMTGFSRSAPIMAGTATTVNVRPTKAWLWYGYKSSDTIYTYSSGGSNTSEILSDNTAKIVSYHNYSSYAGISARDPYSSGHTAYLDADVTYSSDYGYMRFGNATSSNAKPDPNYSAYTSDFTSASTNFSVTTANYKKTITNDGVALYMATAIYGHVSQSASPTQITAIIKAFAME